MDYKTGYLLIKIQAKLMTETHNLTHRVHLLIVVLNEILYGTSGMSWRKCTCSHQLTKIWLIFGINNFSLQYNNNFHWKRKFV